VRVAAIAVALNMAFHAARFAGDWASDPDWPDPKAERESVALAHGIVARSRAPCGTVYAIGDQGGSERATGLRQALPTHGLWFGAFLPSQAARLPDELHAARPDLVYYDRNERLDFLRKFPTAGARIDAWLAADYQPIATDSMGAVWYQRRIANDASACPLPTRFTIPAAGRRALKNPNHAHRPAVTAAIANHWNA
jgi:hypothetical protein